MSLFFMHKRVDPDVLGDKLQAAARRAELGSARPLANHHLEQTTSAPRPGLWANNKRELEDNTNNISQLFKP